MIRCMIRTKIHRAAAADSLSQGFAVPEEVNNSRLFIPYYLNYTTHALHFRDNC